jgi:preprotein translocase subunit SecF
METETVKHMIKLIRSTQIDFLAKRRVASIFSAFLILMGIIALVQITRGKANLGIDFAGGTAVQLKFDKPIRIDEARAKLAANGFPDAELQEFTDGNKLLIRVVKKTSIEEKVADRLIGIFKKEFPENAFVIDSSTEIGPTVGKKLQKDAVVAVTLAMIGIMVYIAVRFEFLFGLAAAIATFHDVLAVLGIFFLMNREITLLVVTGLLTLAGYSLTDTVVVFDRIRENLKRRRRESLESVINGGINQVLSRTLVTSLTTLLGVVALYILGGEVIHDFSLSLLLGVLIGTYSSVFVASPLLLVWKWGYGRLLQKR